MRAAFALGGLGSGFASNEARPLSNRDIGDLWTQRFEGPF